MKAINLSRQALNLRKHIKEGIGHLGNVVVRDDIRSTMSPFRTLPDYRITYRMSLSRHCLVCTQSTISSSFY
jgi:hypothetical protein